MAVDRLRKSSNLLKCLPEGLTSRLVETGARGQAKADSVLFSAGEPGDGLYFIEAGLLKVVMESPGGEESVVSLLGSGEFAGELAMIDGLPRSASVVVLRDCSYRFISKETFQKFTATHPEFYRELARVLSMRLREADQALAAVTFLSGKGRLARALLDLAKHFGK